MSTAIVSAPTRRLLATFSYNFPNWSNTTPFTYQDGQTAAKLLESIIKYVDDTLVPYVDDEMTSVVNAWKETVTEIVAHVDEFDADIEKRLADNLEAINQAVTDVINGAIPVSDPLMAAVVAAQGLFVNEMDTLYARLPKPGEVRQSAFDGAVHVPAIPKTQDGGAFIQAYIDAMEAGDKGTAPLGTVLKFDGTEYHCTTRIKNLIRPLDWVAAGRTKWTTLQNRIGYGGTQIICDIPDISIGDPNDPFIEIGSRLPNIAFFSGVTWENITITGRELVSDNTPEKSNYAPIVPIKFTRFGWDCRMSGLWVRRFRAGVVYDQCYDSAWDDMTVTACGGYINDVLYYALKWMSADENDVCNAMKFKSLHVEACRYYMDFVNARHIEFSAGTKMEMNNYFKPVSFDTDLINSPFRFGDRVMEIVFDGGYIIGSHVGLWLAANPGKTAADVPYMFDCQLNRSEGNSVVKFNGTVFTNGRETAENNSPDPARKRGMKLIKGRNVHMTGVYIDYLTTEVAAIDLRDSRIDNSIVVLGTYGHANGSTAVPISLGVNCSANDVTLRVSGGTANTAIVLNGAGSFASLAVPPVGVLRPVIGGGSSGGGYRALPGVQVIDAVAYEAIYGSAPAYTNMSIDPTRHVNEVIELSFSNFAVTISSITVSQNTAGREIVLFNAGTGVITVNASSSQDGATINPGTAKRYRRTSTKWILV